MDRIFHRRGVGGGSAAESLQAAMGWGGGLRVSVFFCFFFEGKQ